MARADSIIPAVAMGIVSQACGVPGRAPHGLSSRRAYAPHTNAPHANARRVTARRDGVLRAPCAFAGLTLVAMWLSGCRQETPPSDDVQVRAERGPLSFGVRVFPKSPLVGDPVTLEFWAQTPADVSVTFPSGADFGESPARVSAPVSSLPTVAGALRWKQTVQLDTSLSGPLEIPPLVMRYSQPDPDAPLGSPVTSAVAPTTNPVNAGSQPASRPLRTGELALETITLEVRGVLTTQDSTAQPRDITGALLPPPPPWPWWVRLSVVGAALVLAAAGYAALRYWRSRRLRPAPPLAPEVWALRALSELERAEWSEAGRLRENYYRMTEIIRVYIERKFHLAAPEMTTEEFLRMLAGDASRLPYDPARLRAFLEACDLVRYAALRPFAEEALESLRTARVFVSSTAAASQRLESDSARRPAAVEQTADNSSEGAEHRSLTAPARVDNHEPENR